MSERCSNENKEEDERRKRNEKTIKPIATLQKDILTLKHNFNKRGYYDVHFYIDKDIIATYTFKIVKQLISNND